MVDAQAMQSVEGEKSPANYPKSENPSKSPDGAADAPMFNSQISHVKIGNSRQPNYRGYLYQPNEEIIPVIPRCLDFELKSKLYRFL